MNTYKIQFSFIEKWIQKNRAKQKEKKLFSKIKLKDQDSFIEAYNLYVDQIYRFIFFKTGQNQDEAQDLTSSVFLKTWNYIQNNNLKDYKTLKALLYTIARTSIIDYYRKNFQLQNVQISLQNKNFDIADDSQNIAKQVEISSDIERIYKKLSELKNEYREVIILRFVDELSIGEIAKIINKSKGSVRVLIHRSLKTLKSLL